MHLVPILCAAMPLMTLQILFAPATNALGRPGLAVKTGLFGAALMCTAFGVGINWGAEGLAWGWLLGMGALLAVTVELSRPVLKISRADLFLAAAPGLAAAAAMAGVVVGADWLLGEIGAGKKLAILVGVGAATYFAVLFAFARPIVDEVLGLFRPKRETVPAQTA
jgi:O-antigen/teichoic acid export membrane protein